MKKYEVMGRDPRGQIVGSTGRVFWSKWSANRELRNYMRLGGAVAMVPYQGQQVPLVSFTVQELK